MTALIVKYVMNLWCFHNFISITVIPQISSAEIIVLVHFCFLSHIFVVVNVFLIKTAIFCFEKFCFLLLVGDMPEQNIFGILDSDCLVDSISPRYWIILKYFYIQYRYPHSHIIYQLSVTSYFHVKYLIFKQYF